MAAVDNLWAPWRGEYVVGEKPTGCVLCAKHAEGDDEAALVVARGELAYVVLNLFPYNPASIMVVPYRHAASLEDLTTAELAECQALLVHAIRVIRRTYAPGGFNVGLNLGEAAGAGIAAHLHWHLVPRWDGDTNFMPVLADVRVMPQHLNTTWKLLRDAWDEPCDEETTSDGV